jgi:hypothetical protein
LLLAIGAAVAVDESYIGPFAAPDELDAAPEMSHPDMGSIPTLASALKVHEEGEADPPSPFDDESKVVMAPKPQKAAVKQAHRLQLTAPKAEKAEASPFSNPLSQMVHRTKAAVTARSQKRAAALLNVKNAVKSAKKKLSAFSSPMKALDSVEETQKKATAVEKKAPSPRVKVAKKIVKKSAKKPAKKKVVKTAAMTKKAAKEDVSAKKLLKELESGIAAASKAEKNANKVIGKSTAVNKLMKGASPEYKKLLKKLTPAN